MTFLYFLIPIAIIFFVSLIEYLTGVEKQGLKFFVFVIVSCFLFSYAASSFR